MPCWNLLGIEICLPSIDDIVNAVVAPITTFITNSVSGLVTTLTPFFDTVINTLSPIINAISTTVIGWIDWWVKTIKGLGDAIFENLGKMWGDLVSGFSNLGGLINSGLTSLGSSLAAGLSSLSDFILSGLNSLGSSLSGLLNDAWTALSNGLNTLGTSLSGALDTAQTVLLTAFDGMGNAISGIMGGLFTGFGAVDLSAAGTDAQTFSGFVSASLMGALTKHSPMTPEDAYYTTSNLKVEQRDHWFQGYIMALAIEGASLGQVDGPATMLFQAPDVAAAMKLAADWYAAPFDIGWKPLLERYFLREFEPNIPPYQDLISIYVKEGYLESHWVELPAEMVQNFRELGFSEYWTKRLWGKHWEYPSPTQLYEMLHRSAGNFPEIGVSSEVLRDMLKLHDFEPKWRMPLEAISWNTWRIYDIRTGWEMELLDDEGLRKRLIDTGYEPKDASLLAEIQKMFVLRSEIDKLLTESDQDFIEGWISEDQLKADYDATPYNEGVRALRVERAKLRRVRELKRDLKAALTDRFIKGDLSEAEFKEELSRLGVTQEWIATESERALAKKYVKVKEETALAAKGLTEAKYSRSFKVGLITEAQYREKLAALKYSLEDIELLVELNTPEKPAPEELPTLTLGELKAAFRAGVLTENELAAELDFRHYSPEDIAIIIATEKAKIKPTVGE